MLQHDEISLIKRTDPELRPEKVFFIDHGHVCDCLDSTGFMKMLPYIAYVLLAVQEKSMEDPSDNRKNVMISAGAWSWCYNWRQQ